MEVDKIILDELREFRREYKEDRREQAKVNIVVVKNEEGIKKILENEDDKDKRKWRTPIVITCIVSLLTGVNILMKIVPF